MNFIDQLKENIPDGADEGPIQQHLLPHAEIIFRCACRLSRKVHDAEDLTQETFYYAIKNFHQLQDLDKARNWLFAILKNLFLKDMEKNKKRIDVHFDAISNTLSGVTNLEGEFLRGETQKVVRDVLDKLDERLKRPIIMFYYEKLSYKEIGKNLELPIGTVMSRIARGKVYLRRELDQVEPFKNKLGT